MTPKTSANKKPPRNHRPAPARALPLLGDYGRRQTLSRLTFGKFKIQLSADELAALAARAEKYLRDNGTMFGFARHLCAPLDGNGGAANV